ncbi:hypothetical protein M3J09_011561 [Ascochyta lentis]
MSGGQVQGKKEDRTVVQLQLEARPNRYREPVRRACCTRAHSAIRRVPWDSSSMRGEYLQKTLHLRKTGLRFFNVARWRWNSGYSEGGSHGSF